MNTPSDRRERENILAEREVGSVAPAEALTVNEREDVTIHLEQDEFVRQPGSLNRHQLEVLHQLTRLHRSLRGPQTMLETAGGFNRPFPAPPNRQPPHR
jgi:hypothetical protein